MPSFSIIEHDGVDIQLIVSRRSPLRWSLGRGLRLRPNQRFSPSRHFNSHIETRGTRTAGVLSTAVDLAKHQNHKVAIFPTPRPTLRSLAVSPWRRTPILLTRPGSQGPGFRSLVQTALFLLRLNSLARPWPLALNDQSWSIFQMTCSRI
ncbi:hypothetical protein BDP81DRAFT_17932 [Colletotrichum phormii]|uniref:Uncharacterized protein n=1 Tax=Colletotrichum phormii TaxID=359342 RepID=A0AAJ0A753_9PEZI|nr:uncharacterized protein BDP81DRAFT_17932 [Colletotrichum phormii]KAK1656257.1 hypothetical protein BDP81DRAFT_17932 [Colletotrichum phormii]